MNLRAQKTVAQRREAVEAVLKLKLLNIGTFSLDETTASSRNCENMIGVAQIPLGVAGPLKISGSLAHGNFYIPLATTEGALVASVNRGAKAISESGGASVHCHRVGATRGPVFYTGSIKKSLELFDWVNSNREEIAKTAEQTSNHLKFKKAKVKTEGPYAFVRFYFDTQDAMGMNMVTIATQAIADLLEKEVGVECVSVAGNYDIDKKPAWINFINNRGFKVWAEVIVSKNVISDTLKTTAAEIFEVWLAKCMIGSAMSGSLGFNAHYANVVAAFFAATGQDIAHTVEGSMGITTVKVLKGGNMYFSVYLPAIMLGIVGGGTGLSTQKEAIAITGAKKAEELAEILGGAVLAGELSLLSSLAEGTLARAHQLLGRGGRK